MLRSESTQARKRIPTVVFAFKTGVKVHQRCVILTNRRWGETLAIRFGLKMYPHDKVMGCGF